MEDSNSTGFYEVISDCLTAKKNISNPKALLEEISLIAAHRGFNDAEFSLLLDLLITDFISSTNKKKLLPMVVPCSVAPTAAVKKFIAWFISKYRQQIKMQLNVSILQWIIGLLDHDIVDAYVVNIFYFHYLHMLRYKELLKYACNLLCKLTKPEDVAFKSVRFVGKKLTADKDDIYLQAVLNIFRGYKPHLVKKGEAEIQITVKKTNVNVFKNILQNTDFIMKLRNIKLKHLEKNVLECDQIVPFPINKIAMKSVNSQHKISSLIPVPTFDREGLDTIVPIYPTSIESTFKRLWNVAMPQDVLSLLRDDVGFFLLMYRGNNIQTHFSAKLLHTLQKVFIHKDHTAVMEDEEFLLERIYKLQMFMHQGLPCVSIFLAGYLMQWDGLSHRSQILSLIEWATFDSFQDLSSNILCPLYHLFALSDITIKKQILQTCTKLITNMFINDLSRVQKELPHPFLKRSPLWTCDPITMLRPLVAFIEGIILLGSCLHPGETPLLMESIHFYETINMLESRANLPIWTVISAGVVGHTILNIAPVELNRVCRLLLKYSREFLPHLRETQPDYYSECADKINLISKYCQELMNLLWNGQAVARREDGVILKKILTDEALDSVFGWCNRKEMDKSFDVAHNPSFLPYIILERQKNGPEFLRNKEDFVTMLEYYLEDVAEFIKHFQ